MNKFIRKNRKRLLAVFGVFLMISFVATTGSYSRQTRGEMKIGTLNKGKVVLNSGEYSTYVNQWTFLKRQYGQIGLCSVLGGVGTIDPNFVVQMLGDEKAVNEIRMMLLMRQYSPQDYFRQARQNPVAAEMAKLEQQGERYFARFESNEELFPLLVKEAQTLGVGVDKDVIEGILSARGVSKETDSELYEAHQNALRSFLMINNAADISARTVKISEPNRTNRLATQFQRLSLNLMEYSAKDFIEKVSVPTPEQLQKQFDKYKDVEEVGSPDGFGYKYPNRVKYEAIILKKDELKKGISEVTEDQQWEYFLRNPNEFTTDKPATTQDAFNIGGPTTRPMKFPEAKEKIVLKLTNQRVDELAAKIREAIRSTMKADYDAYKAATANKATTAPAPASSLGVPYDSKEYLAKLRDKIQADFKVTPTIEREEGLQTPTSLTDSKLGKEAYTSDMGLPFTQYMTSMLDPFLNERDRRSLSARPDFKAVAVWEPTPAFSTVGGDGLIARATVAEPAHVPSSLDEVKDKVAADAKRAAAYELAREAAKAAANSATAGGKLIASVADEQKKTVYHTGIFDVRSLLSGVPLTGYELKGNGFEQFASECTKLLTLPPRTGQATRVASTQGAATKPVATTSTSIDLKDHPLGIIELKGEGKVLLAEVDQIKPMWIRERESTESAQVALQNASQLIEMMRMLWLDYTNAVKRVDFVPAVERQKKNPGEPAPAEPPAPFNPFTGTILP